MRPRHIRVNRARNIEISHEFNNFEVEYEFVWSMDYRIRMLQNIDGRPKVILKLLEPYSGSYTKYVLIINSL